MNPFLILIGVLFLIAGVLNIKPYSNAETKKLPKVEAFIQNDHAGHPESVVQTTTTEDDVRVQIYEPKFIGGKAMLMLIRQEYRIKTK